MAFKSLVGTGCRPEPSVRFRANKGGSCSGYLNKNTNLHGLIIDIQVDQNTRQIRIRPADNGVRVGKAGTFGCSRKNLEICGSDIIWLTLHDDGWLYGEFGAAEGGAV